jgi:UDP:flavonoid glycosyltransferase YjiC (YdhE family)
VAGVKILVAVPPGYGLMLPLVPLAWAARVAGHEILVATTAEMIDVGARSGLAMCDVLPDRDVWDELLRAVSGQTESVSEEFRLAGQSGNPFGLFTLTMTEGTVAAGRAFDAELVVHTSDHVAGALAARALGVPALEVGNRVSWSIRDADFREGRDPLRDDDVVRRVRAKLGIGDGWPETVARIDPRPPSMGGLVDDEPDPRDGVPWWPIRYVPYNGGAVVPDWALRRPDRPRVLVTLGTVVPTISGASNLGVVLEALGGMDVEVVLAAGSMDLSTLGKLPSNVRSVGFLALSAVLPTCALIVHHGGSGTTASPLHYGVPQLVMPGFADNSLSAQRVTARGVGLSQDPGTATVAGVRELLHRLLTEPAFAEAAAQVSAEMATQPDPSVIINRVTAILTRAPVSTA